MPGPSVNQLVLFSLECWCFPRLRLGKHQNSRENKTNCFHRDLTLIIIISGSSSSGGGGGGGGGGGSSSSSSSSTIIINFIKP